MSKGSVSSHYVPRLILRKFSDKVCLYNVKTGELQENIVPEHAYMIDDLYDRETEKKLNEKIESQFGNLLSNVILKADKEISLTRPQLKCFIITLMKPYSIGSCLSGTVFLFIYSYVVCKKQRIRTHPQLGISSDYLCLCCNAEIDKN